jgi:Na+/H+ antiporter NhaA
VAHRISQSTRDFFATENAGDIALVLSAALALILAISPIGHGYQTFWHPYQSFISEGLMSIFFFVVGLEIKHKFVQGRIVRMGSADDLGSLIVMVLLAWVVPARKRFSVDRVGRVVGKILGITFFAWLSVK